MERLEVRLLEKAKEVNDEELEKLLKESSYCIGSYLEYTKKIEDDLQRIKDIANRYRTR